jgi:tRNA(Ile)-lysidine synthase
MPGEVELPELGLRLRVRRTPIEPWMLRGERRRVGFESAADHAIVRSRRPGERMRPLGSPGSRKLKAILIDRGIPAEDRDRLPLLVVEGELAWVPGVALGDRFALRGDGDCWLAELETLPGAVGASRSAERTES